MYGKKYILCSHPYNHTIDGLTQSKNPVGKQEHQTCMKYKQKKKKKKKKKKKDASHKSNDQELIQPDLKSITSPQII